MQTPAQLSAHVQQREAPHKLQRAAGGRSQLHVLLIDRRCPVCPGSSVLHENQTPALEPGGERLRELLTLRKRLLQALTSEVPFASEASDESRYNKTVGLTRLLLE